MSKIRMHTPIYLCDKCNRTLKKDKLKHVDGTAYMLCDKCIDRFFSDCKQYVIKKQRQPTLHEWMGGSDKI